MKRKKFMKVGIVVLACMVLLSGAALATDGLKSIKVNYKNIKVLVNNSLKTSDEEPFLLDGRTYVPLRFVSEALGAKVNWDGATNTVSINLNTTDAAELETLKGQLTEKEYQIIKLQTELEAIKKDLDKETKSKNKFEVLEEKLMDDYDKLKNVNIGSIELKGNEDKTKVRIEVDLNRKDLDAWSDLRDRDIENWLKNLVSDIQSEFSKNTKVTGIIYDTREREDIIEFEKDGKASLKVDLLDNDYRNTKSSTKDVEKDLRGMSWKIDGYYFIIDYIKYDKDDITLELVYDDSGSFGRNDWNKLENVEKDIEALCKEIFYEFKDNANADPEYIFMKILDSNLSPLDDFRFDVDSWRLR